MSQPAPPPAIEPDDKNWTWVLEHACPECGFDPLDHPRDAIAADVRGVAAAFAALLEHPRVAVRPAPQVWSALEYGCHVRDVFRLSLYRLDLMLEQDAPTFANWDQDVTAVEARYDLQDPGRVRAELIEAGTALADRYAAVAGDAWARTGLRSDGSRFTVESFGVYLLHDPLHHVVDVQRGDAALGSST